jgi:hypothetical protein
MQRNNKNVMPEAEGGERGILVPSQSSATGASLPQTVSTYHPRFGIRYVV